jgi:CrcB protein
VSRYRAIFGSLPVLGVVALGGVVGALLRYQAGLIWPTPAGAFPTTILLVNLIGCLVMGVFMVLITEFWTPHALLRPFFGTGVLGGFTTFSTYSLDIVTLFGLDHPLTAASYLFVTPVGAMLAVGLGILITRRVVTRQ